MSTTMQDDRPASGDSGREPGVDGLIAGVSRYAAQVTAGRRTRLSFLLAIADDYAYIRLIDVVHPVRFLRQLAGAPPQQLGTAGFAPRVIDDPNPARHYMAFVFVGFWLPLWAAVAVLWVWEAAGFVRYGGYWSPEDIVCGEIGIRHGRLLRRTHPAVLPGLIAADLAADAADFSVRPSTDTDPDRSA